MRKGRFSQTQGESFCDGAVHPAVQATELVEIDGVYSGNPWILDVFSRYGIPTYKVERSNNISGYEIRQLIYADDEEWHRYVPSVNIKLIEEWRISHFSH